MILLHLHINSGSKNLSEQQKIKAKWKFKKIFVGKMFKNYKKLINAVIPKFDQEKYAAKEKVFYSKISNSQKLI